MIGINPSTICHIKLKQKHPRIIHSYIARISSIVWPPLVAYGFDKLNWVNIDIDMNIFFLKSQEGTTRWAGSEGLQSFFFLLLTQNWSRHRKRSSKVMRWSSYSLSDFQTKYQGRNLVNHHTYKEMHIRTVYQRKPILVICRYIRH